MCNKVIDEGRLAAPYVKNGHGSIPVPTSKLKRWESVFRSVKKEFCTEAASYIASRKSKHLLCTVKQQTCNCSTAD
jgi:hypothetical protein